MDKVESVGVVVSGGVEMSGGEICRLEAVTGFAQAAPGRTYK